MPQQRTLLAIVASLVVILSFLVGYIAGQPAHEKQSLVQAVNSKRVVASKLTVPKQTKDLAQKSARSSYTTVYANDNGEIFPAKSIPNEESRVGAIVTKKITPKRRKAKVAYSWRRKKIAQSENLEIQRKTEQGDGYYVRPSQARPVMQQPSYPRTQQPRYYAPTPPQMGYGISQYGMQNNYPIYPTRPSYFMPY